MINGSVSDADRLRASMTLEMAQDDLRRLVPSVNGVHDLHAPIVLLFIELRSQILASFRKTGR